MKQIIKNVLDDVSDNQINLASDAARETVSSLISAALKAKGSYKEYTEYELDEQKAREYWVCGVCGKSTFEVEEDYLVHPRLHLGCALEEEDKGKDIKEQYIEACEDIDETDKDKKVDWFDSKRVTGDRRKGNRREKNWSQTKHEDKVFNHQSRVDKLAEEVVSDNDTDYIYESPDGGKTVYKRKVGGSKRELVKDWKKINVRK